MGGVIESTTWMLNFEFELTFSNHCSSGSAPAQDPVAQSGRTEDELSVVRHQVGQPEVDLRAHEERSLRGEAVQVLPLQTRRQRNRSKTYSRISSRSGTHIEIVVNLEVA